MMISLVGCNWLYAIR